MMGNSPSLGIVNINANTKFGQNLFICSKDIERKRNSDINQGHNSVTNKSKMTGNNPNIDLVNINADITFGESLLICSQDIERKQNSDAIQGP